MLKDTMLYLARQDRIRAFVTHNGAARRVARRFVAGESLDDAMDVAAQLNRQGIKVSLDHLGENVSDASEASATAANYITILNHIHQSGADANISVKLTALGLDVGEDLCRQNLTQVLQRARDLNIFVRVDMEGSDYTQRTIDLVLELRKEFELVGTVVQSMLYRTPKDVEQLIASGTRVRLVKGAYLEAPSIAYPHKSEVDRQYVQLMHELLEHGIIRRLPHTTNTLSATPQAFARSHDIGAERFEFQMLYGIRRDLQERLAREGHNVRVYVPYGTQWYPYLTRRMAERPANLIFVMSNAFRG